MNPAYKKLAVVVDTFPKWSERFIARELQELKRRGVDLSVFYFNPGVLPFQDDPEWDDLLPLGRELPLKVGTIPLVNVDVNSAAKAARHLQRILTGERFQHVHAHFANVPSSVGLDAAEEAGLPFSMSVHARDLFVDARDLERKISKAVRIFTCHGRASEFLKSRGAANVTCMHHGLPLDRFASIPRGESARPPKFLAVCRFVKKKGLLHAIEAMIDSRLKALGVELELIGEGPESAALKKRVQDLKLESRVRFVAPMSSKELLHAFKTAMALIAPYETAPDGDADGIPNVLLEAFAAGLPVIGTSAGSLPEVLTPETGEVVPEGDSRALTEALVDAAERSFPREKAAAARRLVEREFDIRANIAPLIAILSLKSSC